MSGEFAGTSPELSETDRLGMKYMDMLGLQDVMHDPVSINGTMQPAYTFLDHNACREQALPILEMIAGMDEGDPRRQKLIPAYRSAVTKILGIEQAEAAKA